ncbi:MAG TPA: dihydrolipoamide acetyltransferase family protein [Ktedonobacteraceae bacterium]|jgi:pyruvate dehydrogenase E2 component (dihydrolipoamide acetyltransferase)|nr:dihydrolipoamide acetyltransferase family protein [Ktedonobacteraceae bacterium]
MATNVILPALGMAQETGTIVRWLKNEGEQVQKGEPLAEVETDKAVVELESPASGTLAAVTGVVGEPIPVGQVIAQILSQNEAASNGRGQTRFGKSEQQDAINHVPTRQTDDGSKSAGVAASPLASRIAAEHNLDIRQITPSGRRVQKADVLSYLQSREAQPVSRFAPASPKARRLASERGLELSTLQGSGPGGAVLAADVLAASPVESQPEPVTMAAEPVSAVEEMGSAVGTIWRIMAERTTQSWTIVPHFYLMREVDASRLIAWRAHLQKRGLSEVTYTDLLVKVVAAALREHARVNASWHEGRIIVHQEINVGLAVAVEDGLVVPVIHGADKLSLREIARRRQEVVALAQAGKLHPRDISNATFTISNLGMYGVDAFNAIINSPQAAILAVGRIAERVVPVQGQPAVRPMMVLNLSCDHRVIDGARGAQFLSRLADLLEEPLDLLE